jgi:hypothetical protein
MNMQNGSPPDNKLAWSNDLGKNWQFSSWVFPKTQTFFPSTFMNAGRDNSAAEDNYIYSYGARWVFTQGAENDLYLARVPKDKIKDRNSYEFFAGFGTGSNPLWTSDVNSRKPVFTDPNGVGNQGLATVNYNPHIKRYILAAGHHKPGGAVHGPAGCLGLFDGPTPWGPWTTVAYYDNWLGLTEGDFLGWHFPGKWMVDNGLTMWCSFSTWGDGTKYHDHFNVMKSTLELKTVKKISLPAAGDRPVLRIVPNPFREITRIVIGDQYSVNSYRVYDMHGRVVKRLPPAFNKGGIEWDGSDLPGGQYIIRVSTGSESFVKTAVKIK